MCLILFGYHAHPAYPLVLAGNRDEFHERPSAPAEFWPSNPAILGGRDLAAGGSWLAVSRQGKLAAVTNFRDGQPKAAHRSRGHLVSDYIGSNLNGEEQIQSLAPVQAEYGGFNLLLWDSQSLHYSSNRMPEYQAVTPGIHGLSNHLLDSPWPKVEAGKQKFQAQLEGSREQLIGGLFDLLTDRAQSPDDHLPQTGVPLDWERKLSAAFIHTPAYGTRASTVIVVDREGHLDFAERCFDSAGQCTGERRFRLMEFASQRNYRTRLI
ncbi:MAG: NRDE family protein [Betaproteobacteria bacterium]|nr:NRDE family protein [Betaproteobacteria bacterium]